MKFFIGSLTVLLIALSGAVLWIYKQGRNYQKLDNVNDRIKDKNKLLKRIPDILRDANSVFHNGVQHTIKKWWVKTTDSSDGMDTPRKK